jgi:hypothetical protein
VSFEGSGSISFSLNGEGVDADLVGVGHDVRGTSVGSCRKCGK